MMEGFECPEGMNSGAVRGFRILNALLELREDVCGFAYSNLIDCGSHFPKISRGQVRH